MSASDSATITVTKTTSLKLDVSEGQLEAVMAALKPFMKPAAPTLSIVPSDQEPDVPGVTVASPKDVAKRITHPTAKVESSSQAKVVATLKVTPPLRPGKDLIMLAPPASERVEFILPSQISGTPIVLKELANRVLAEMPWLIELTPDPSYVRKGLEMNSDRVTGNPNHGALLTLMKTQQSLLLVESKLKPLASEQAPVEVDNATLSKPSGSSSKLGRPSKPGLTPAQVAAKKAQRSAASKTIDPKTLSGHKGQDKKDGRKK